MIKKKTPINKSIISGVVFKRTDEHITNVAIALAKAIERNAEAIIAVAKLGDAPMLSVSDSTGLLVSDCVFQSRSNT